MIDVPVMSDDFLNDWRTNDWLRWTRRWRCNSWRRRWLSFRAANDDFFFPFHRWRDWGGRSSSSDNKIFTFTSDKPRRRQASLSRSNDQTFMFYCSLGRARFTLIAAVNDLFSLHLSRRLARPSSEADVLPFEFSFGDGVGSVVGWRAGFPRLTTNINFLTLDIATRRWSSGLLSSPNDDVGFFRFPLSWPARGVVTPVGVFVSLYLAISMAVPSVADDELFFLYFPAASGCHRAAVKVVGSGPVPGENKRASRGATVVFTEEVWRAAGTVV